MSNRQRYSTDLTDSQWERIAPLVPPPRPGGRPAKHSRREIVNGVFYVLRTGCSWALMPHDLPSGKTVYHYFRQWRIDGTWKTMHDTLRGDLREAHGRKREPSAGIIDSQTVKVSFQPGERGYDAAKKSNGRKRHILVDVVGFVVLAIVHPANVQDRDGARSLLEPLRTLFTRLRRIWADGAYSGNPLKSWLRTLRDGTKHPKIDLQIVRRPRGIKGFVVLFRRWVVERTFGWLGAYRRLSKDYETLTDTSEVMIYIAMIELMSRRLAAM